MKQLLFLLLFPCLALAQYTGNGNQKITLGEQTTADGLVFRGVTNDTNVITPFSDTSAYIILDTVNNRFFHYKRNTNVWSIAGGSDTTLIAYVNTYGAQTVNGAKTLTSNLILKNSQEPSRATIVSTQGFAADTTNWTRGAGWTFNGTQAVATAATGDLTYTSSPTITSGNAYEITYTVTGYTGGVLSIILGNGTAIALPSYNVTNFAVLTFPTTATGGLRFTTLSFTGNLDNVSVVEITGSAPVLFAGQDDGSATLYNSLRMPNSTTFAFGGGGSRTSSTGINNLFFGTNAGQNNTTGQNNVFSGSNAGQNNTSGSANLFFGTNAGQNNTTGQRNIFFGLQSGQNNTTGVDNSFFGTNAGNQNTTGTDNIFFGSSSGNQNTTGRDNVFFGSLSGQNNKTGGFNIYFGTQAGRFSTTGSGNLFLGYFTGYNNRQGNDNIAIGSNALANTNAGDTLSGSNNIAIGKEAANNARFAAANNVVIGNQVDLPVQDGLNQGVYQNVLFFTGASGTGTTIAGQVGIAVNTPTARLHLVAGTATASTAPLKFTSGTNLTTAEAGAMEFNGTNLFFSPSTTRHTVNHGLTGSATLNFPSTTTLLSADLTITVTGAADGDVVSLGVPNAAVNANTCYTAWVSTANTVTVRFNNYSSGTVDPASALFKVFVTK